MASVKLQNLLVRKGETFKHLINVKNALFHKRQINKRTEDGPAIKKERHICLKEASA